MHSLHAEGSRLFSDRSFYCRDIWNVRCVCFEGVVIFTVWFGSYALFKLFGQSCRPDANVSTSLKCGSFRAAVFYHVGNAMRISQYGVKAVLIMGWHTPASPAFEGGGFVGGVG